jgi:hypothetical protein
MPTGWARREDHVVTHFVGRDAWPHSIDNACSLMSEDNRNGRGEGSVGQTVIRVADAAVFYAYAHLAGSGIRQVDVITDTNGFAWFR